MKILIRIDEDGDVYVTQTSGQNVEVELRREDIKTDVYRSVIGSNMETLITYTRTH